MAPASDSPSLARFIHALGENKIPFLIIGMTAAVLQGIPVVTADVDFWIGTPESEHDVILQICHSQGAKFLTDHVVDLADGLQLNFTYSVCGLKSFAQEMKHARKINWFGRIVPVLSLEQIQKSKRAVGRPKDKVHLFYLEQALKMKVKSRS